MIIISHRGYWNLPEEKNTNKAFDQSFSLNFGTETDLRDHEGELVISHDPAQKNSMSAELFFSTYIQYEKRLPLALNIKADGLQKLLAAAIKRYDLRDYFVFDMSTPDMVEYLNKDIKVFTRQSEFEITPVLYDESKGVWIDSFISNWINEDTIRVHIDNGKQVCLVSPELHKRSYREEWERLKKMPIITSPDVMLCTDYPEQARSFFHE